MSAPETPIVVPASATGPQVATGARDLVLLVAALPALVAVLGTGDVKAIVDWLASEPGLAFVGLAIAIVTSCWRQWKARRAVRELQVLERNVPARVAVLKGTQA